MKHNLFSAGGKKKSYLNDLFIEGGGGRVIESKVLHKAEVVTGNKENYTERNFIIFVLSIAFFG
jgi:hypothetical protein